MEISVIIPIYKGKRYLPYLMEILSINFRLFYEKYHKKCEAIFVNDCPEEVFTLPETDISVHLFHMEQNQGIHGARVFGYRQAKGKYLLFLDQDDRIAENYLISQRQCIGREDAVICNGYRERFCVNWKRMIYTKLHCLETTKKLDRYITKGNRILSPGQVLMKKAAVPELWLSQIMKNNGADDYFLWLLMLKNGCVFATNEVCLYTHVENGYNTSSSYKSMIFSVEEMLALLKKNCILDDAEIKIIGEQVGKSSVRMRQALKEVRIYDYWMYLSIRNIRIKDYFNHYRYGNIAIYGMGYIGNRLYDELVQDSINVVLGIDRDADGILYDNMPVLSLDSPALVEYMKKIDLVVVAVVTSYQEIVQDMRKICDNPIVSIEEILLELVNQLEGK